MGRASASLPLAITPAEAFELWADTERWPAFVDGFARVVEVSGDWPETGATLVWESTPGGRGRVTERVAHDARPPPGPDVAAQSHPGRFVTAVEEEALSGWQEVTFKPSPDGTLVELALDYELARHGPLRAITDVVFIRRALRDSLRRTLRRFAAEASGNAEAGPR